MNRNAKLRAIETRFCHCLDRNGGSINPVATGKVLVEAQEWFEGSSPSSLQASRFFRRWLWRNFRYWTLRQARREIQTWEVFGSRLTIEAASNVSKQVLYNLAANAKKYSILIDKVVAAASSGTVIDESWPDYRRLTWGRYCFKVRPEVAANVKKALALAKQQTGSDDTAVQLDWICMLFTLMLPRDLRDFGRKQPTFTWGALFTEKRGQ